MEKIPIRHINPVQKEPDYFQSFSIRDIQTLSAGGDLIQALHRHDFFYILTIKEGTGEHIIDFQPYKIQDNSVFFLRSGQVHQLLLNAGSTGYLLQFKPDFFYPTHHLANQRLRKASNKNFRKIDGNRFIKLQATLTSIYQEYNEKKEGYKEAIMANLDLFFIELIRQSQTSETPENKVTPYTQEKLEEFLELLETHGLNHKQVSQYAALLNVTSYQLNVITKTTLGKTCLEVMNERILLEAKRYLLATTSLVNQIAYHLGFEDVSYFIRFFKKHTGYSPAAFRQNFK